VIPYANLKFRSRLYDIKKQKPALYLESGVFNDDFQGYSIRIGRKHADNKTIENVMVDEDRGHNTARFNFIRAKEGDMFVTDDDRFFVMNLRHGYQYQKAEPTSNRSKNPFIRTKFREWSKTFDLGEFDLNRTDENLFKSYHAMLSTNQLAEGIDSIKKTMVDLQEELRADVWRKMDYFFYEPSLDTLNRKRIQRDQPKLTGDNGFENDQDTTLAIADPKTKISGPALVTKSISRPPNGTKSTISTMTPNFANNIMVPQPHLDSLYSGESIVSLFEASKRMTYIDNARNAVRSSKNFHYEYQTKVANELERKQRYTYQLHSKYGFAMVCFIFLFIGAPMGAIVRKGGFGYPLLVAIFFFMFFIVLTKLFEKLSRSASFDATIAAWLPCLILFPMGLFLTIRAMNDSKILNFDRIKILLTRISKLWPFKLWSLPPSA
jgi:lipopolysaccharide export system permease protein